MNKNKDTEESVLLEQLLSLRAQLAEIEDEWKTLRAGSRNLTTQLVTQYGYSINKASTVSGHMRSTILTWLAADGFQVKE